MSKNNNSGLGGFVFGGIALVVAAVAFFWSKNTDVDQIYVSCKKQS